MCFVKHLSTIVAMLITLTVYHVNLVSMASWRLELVPRTAQSTGLKSEVMNPMMFLSPGGGPGFHPHNSTCTSTLFSLFLGLVSVFSDTRVDMEPLSKTYASTGFMERYTVCSARITFRAISWFSAPWSDPSPRAKKRDSQDRVVWSLKMIAVIGYQDRFLLG